MLAEEGSGNDFEKVRGGSRGCMWREAVAELVMGSLGPRFIDRDICNTDYGIQKEIIS